MQAPSEARVEQLIPLALKQFTDKLQVNPKQNLSACTYKNSKVKVLIRKLQCNVSSVRILHIIRKSVEITSLTLRSRSLKLII